MKVSWTKDDMKDSRGYPLTQSLFLEINYSDYAIWTFNNEPKEYNGKVYPSLRQYYMDIADPTEYQFAQQCTLGWDHWKRLSSSDLVRKEVVQWREELEVALRSEGVMAIIDATAQEGGNFQAAKWLTEKGWEKSKVGRPSKGDAEKEKRINDRVLDFKADVVRLKDFK